MTSFSDTDRENSRQPQQEVWVGRFRILGDPKSGILVVAGNYHQLQGDLEYMTKSVAFYRSELENNKRFGYLYEPALAAHLEAKRMLEEAAQ